MPVSGVITGLGLQTQECGLVISWLKIDGKSVGSTQEVKLVISGH